MVKTSEAVAPLDIWYRQDTLVFMFRSELANFSYNIAYNLLEIFKTGLFDRKQQFTNIGLEKNLSQSSEFLNKIALIPFAAV